MPARPTPKYEALRSRIRLDPRDQWMLSQRPTPVFSGKKERTRLDGFQIRINGKREYMHRVVLGASVGEQVDHRNGDVCDNRRSNLRLCTQGQNNSNRGKISKLGRATSDYKGVDWCESHYAWRARCGPRGAIKYLGYFHSEHDAARAYNAAALQVYGEFAKLNVVAITRSP